MNGEENEFSGLLCRLGYILRQASNSQERPIISIKYKLTVTPKVINPVNQNEFNFELYLHS